MALSKMNEKYGPLYAEATIPAATYKGMDKDAQNNTVWNIMAVNASMSDDLAYELTKMMLEKRADLALVHKEALNIKPEWQTTNRAGIAVASGRAEVLQRGRHQGRVGRRRRTRAPAFGSRGVAWNATRSAELASARTAGALSLDAREKVERYIEEEEGAFNRLGGRIGRRSPRSQSPSRSSISMRPTRSCRPMCCGLPTSAWCSSSASSCSRWRTGSATASAGGTICSPAASAGTILYVLSQGAYFGDRATMPTTTD